MRTIQRSDAHVVRAVGGAGAATPSDARVHNRSLMIAALLRSGPMSRADLAREVGLTAAAASGVVAQMLDQGLVEQVGTRSNGVGRPATMVALRADARHAICLDLSDDTTFRGGIVDLAGCVVRRDEVPREDRVGDDALERVASLVTSLVGAATAPLLGVGCGTPGVVDGDGVVVQSVDLEWAGVALAAVLAEAAGVAAFVVNDANAAALAEYSFGGRDGNGLLLVRVVRGVGAGIVLDGHLAFGSGNAAGEIGHVTVVEDGSVCACGNTGCLEIAIAAARRGDGGDVHEEVGRHLGLALAPLVGTLDLGNVVLSGDVELLTDELLHATRTHIRQRVLPSIGERLRLSRSALGDDDVLLGAAALVQRAQLRIA